MFAEFLEQRMNEPTENTQQQQPVAVLRSSGSSQHPVHRIFTGPDGLRPGWRLFIFLLIAGLVGFAMAGVTALWHPSGAGKLWQSWLFEFELFLATLISANILAKVEGRSAGEYGLSASGAVGKNFWVGAAWGFGWLSVLMIMLRLAGVFSFGGLAIHGPRIVKFAAFYALMFLTVGLFEEYLFRGYPLFVLTQGRGFWFSAILLSIIFGGVHYNNQGEGWIGLLGAALIGLFFCLTIRRTGSLWFAVGFHASWDWGESYFYSTPDSGQISVGHLLNSSFHGSRWLTGGSIGPEGSLLVFVVIALMWVAFERVYREVRYPAIKSA